MSNAVELAVYDLSRGMARSMSQAILGQRIDGIWHTGIVVFGYEYYFGGGIQKSPRGAFAQSNQLPPVSMESMGQTTKTLAEFEAYLATIRNRYTAMTYDLINNNCNNFADTICHFLVGHGIPTHIVDLPRIVFSTPGGAMLRPMIENMQNNIRQQHGSGLDPFGGSDAASGVRFEQQLSESVTGLVMNTMQQQQQQSRVLKKAKLEDRPLLSMDAGTVQGMEKLLHNLAAHDNSSTPGSALTESEHATLHVITQKLLTDSGKGAAPTTAFGMEEYMLLEKLLANYPKAQSPTLFLLRLMFVHDRSSAFHDLSIVKELLRRLVCHVNNDADNGFSSVPAHVMALCAIANLISHEAGVAAFYQNSSFKDSAKSASTEAKDVAMDVDNSTEVAPKAQSQDTILNDLVDVVLAGLGTDHRSEVRRMSTTLAYNLTLVCTRDFKPSGPWQPLKSDGAAELNPHALQLLCACLEQLSQESDAVVRSRRLSIACRIARSYATSAGSLLQDLGFGDVLESMLVSSDVKPVLVEDEKDMLRELVYYCREGSAQSA